MDDILHQSDLTIAAFQREDACRRKMEAANYRCHLEQDGMRSIELKNEHTNAVARWLNAIEETRAAHMATHIGAR